MLCIFFFCLPRVEAFNDINHFHYITNMATPKGNNPDLGIHEIYNVGIPFLVLSLSALCLLLEKKILKRVGVYRRPSSPQELLGQP